MSGFYLKYWWRYSTLNITHFEGMDNFMKMLIPLFPNCALVGLLHCLQWEVGLLQHAAGVPLGIFVLCLCHHLPAGDGFANSGMAGDDQGPVEVLLEANCCFKNNTKLILLWYQFCVAHNKTKTRIEVLKTEAFTRSANGSKTVPHLTKQRSRKIPKM